MCGRFTLLTSPQVLVEHFNLIEAPAIVPRYNIAPSQAVLAVGLSRDGRPAPASFRWGLVPAWAPNVKKAPINARIETVVQLPTFAEAFQKRRCLIPADGFYEWERLADGGKRPWAFRLADGGPFAFAGLWESWRPPEGGQPLLTCALLTTKANAVVRPVHGRMPVVLKKQDYAAWMDRGLQEPAKLLPLLKSTPSANLEAKALGPAVNNARYDGPECLTGE